MSKQTEPIEPDPAPPAPTGATATTEPVTAAPPAPSTPVSPTAASVPRRSVTVPLLPVAIVGGVIAALLFLGGGVAIGYGVASHDSRFDNAQQYRGGNSGYRFGNGTGNGNGFAPGQNQGGQNPGQNQGGQNHRPGKPSTPAPNNG
ncbi:MAG: hypothetical protein M3N46_10745 [Actinomycetota bacterium]|nr:hypothetical protein [Actinomycetota bacterium]